MAFEIGTVTLTGGVSAHNQFIQKVRALAISNGWSVMRYVDTGDTYELILKGSGLSGTEEIFVGLKAYQNVSADYYNLAAAVFTGYVAANSFTAQPGAIISGIPAHNNAITYYLTVNAQRIAFMLKVGTPVYTHGYLGKFLPYVRPGEYPYPVLCAGCLNGMAETRFSDTSLYFPYHGKTVNNNAYLTIRKQDGSAFRPTVWPFTNGQFNDGNCLAGSAASGCQVPLDGKYQLEALVMHDPVSGRGSGSIYGELDGVYFVSGFNNGVENIIQVGGSSIVDQTGLSQSAAVTAIKAVGGKAYVVGQNINLTSWRDYIALEM